MSLKRPSLHLYGVILVLMIAATLCAAFLMETCARLPGHLAAGVVDAARDAAAMFRQTLGVQPQVSINQTVYYEQIAPVAEFAVVTRVQVMRLSYSHQLTLLNHPIPETTKYVTLEAPYRIKAGFDLREPFTVTIDPATNQITADLPPAHILSVELAGELTYQDADGWFNRITSEDRQKLLNDLQQQAHTSAEASDLCHEAERQAKERLQEVAQHNGRQAVFRFRISP